MGIPNRAVGVRSDGLGPVGGRLPVVADEPQAIAFRHATTGLALAGPDGAIHEANPSFCRFLGYERPALLRRRLSELVHANDREAHVAWYGRLLAGDVNGYERDQRFLRLDGTDVWGRMTVTAVHDRAGGVGHAVCEVGPIESGRTTPRPTPVPPSTRRSDGDDRLAAREHFLSLVSHEFRTPLTSIQGYSELLAGSPTGLEEVAEFAHVIHHQAVRLAATLDGMLLLDRLRSGALTVLPEPTDVNTAANEVVARFGLARPDRPVDLDLMPALPLAQADRGRLLQALAYLLANADDRSPDGSPIAVSTRRERGSVCIAVADRGAPIALAEPGRAHDQFELAELERVRSGGVGMELAIVREIARLHGGRTWVECAEGGCAFHLRLPAVRRSAAAGGLAPG